MFVSCAALRQINVREYRRGNQKWTIQKTGNIAHTRQRQTKQKHNTICVGHNYTQANTNNTNKIHKQLEVTYTYKAVGLVWKCIN